VSVTASYDGPPDGAPAAAPGATPPHAPTPVTVPVAEDGTYNTPLQLTTGKWSIVVTATGAANKTAALTRHVTVAYKGVNLVVEIKGGPAWIKVWVDGKLDPNWAGVTARKGKVITFTANNSVEVGVARAGRPSSRSTASRSGRSGSGASPRRGCSSRRPPRRRRPTRSVAGDPLVGLAERLQGLCLGRGVTVALAESCTGGLVADAITDVAGSSGYFAGGVVSYSNEAKESLLGVSGAVLAAHGAVSAQVARAMAEGARPVRDDRGRVGHGDRRPRRGARRSRSG
jgi:hypothetical protein